jgi:hypothetical protein
MTAKPDEKDNQPDHRVAQLYPSGAEIVRCSTLAMNRAFCFLGICPHTQSSRVCTKISIRFNVSTFLVNPHDWQHRRTRTPFPW